MAISKIKSESIDLTDTGYTFGDLLVSGDLTIDTSSLTVDSANNRVGIGTTSPSSVLHIYDTIPLITLQDADTDAVARINASSGNIFLDTSGVNRDVIFRSDATEVARITGDGKVGIGTSSPSAKLDVFETVASTTSSIWTGENLALVDDTAYAQGVGGALIFEGKFNSSGSYSTFGYIRGSKNDASDGGFQGGIVYGTRNGDHVFVTNSNGLTDGTDERMRIDSSGNVGIGTSSPTAKLQVEGTLSVRTSSSQSFNDSSNANNLTMNDSKAHFNLDGVDKDFQVSSDNNTHMLFVDGGNDKVGIGTSSINSVLEISSSPNNQYIIFDSTSAGTNGAILGGILAENQGDSVGGIFVRRESASNDARITFETQATGGSLAARMELTSNGHLLPIATNTYDLGSSSQVWRNIYTSDFHMSNEGLDKGNDIDGTKGSWTFQEGEENLYLINNKNGKKYKFNLTEIE